MLDIKLVCGDRVVLHTLLDHLHDNLLLIEASKINIRVRAVGDVAYVGEDVQGQVVE